MGKNRKHGLIPMGLADPATGEMLYIRRRYASRWRSWWECLRMFVYLCWRRSEDGCKRIPVGAAWYVAKAGHDLNMEANRQNRKRAEYASANSTQAD